MPPVSVAVSGYAVGQALPVVSCIGAQFGDDEFGSRGGFAKVVRKAGGDHDAGGEVYDFGPVLAALPVPVRAGDSGDCFRPGAEVGDAGQDIDHIVVVDGDAPQLVVVDDDEPVAVPILRYCGM